MFAGKECSRALAKMSLSDEDCNDKLEDLSKHQLEVLHDWEAKFQEKYQVVGKVCISSANDTGFVVPANVGSAQKACMPRAFIT